MRDELVFTPILSAPRPRGITYDPVSKKIYWSEGHQRRIIRADMNGSNIEAITLPEEISPAGMDGIAIANKSRTLYIAYRRINKISSMSIAEDSPLPWDVTDFLTEGLIGPRELAVDEEQGYLYWSMDYTIARTFLNGSGNTEVIYKSEDLKNLTGLTIDLTRKVRRVFFCEFNQKKTLYKDVITSPNASDVSEAYELSEYLYDPSNIALKARHVTFYNDALYCLQLAVPQGIGIMTDYDQTNRSYNFQEISQFVTPYRMHIAYIID
ncbi:low-density lipoprotein receptor-related protein 5-like [Strongylocentrotus purpuratus]|uniref:Uncharacterized protein n=1 Tax=Strongylocentrotus purpuratus TaxID=7668 RepID=A0A7M7NA58_STRPU|nr:low-density lipoprotein receptor-related protein 5-like [Strongylocentrotus purpuratus]